MRFSAGALLLLTAIVAGIDHMAFAAAKKPSRPPPSSGRSRSSSRASPPGSKKRPSVSKRRYDPYDDEEEDEEEDVGFSDQDVDEELEIDIEVDFEEEEDDDDYRPRPRKSPKSSSRRPPASKKKGPRSRYPDGDDEYDRPPRPRKGPPPRSGRGPPPRRPGGRGRVVPYTRQKPSSFARGLDAIKSSMPDPNSVKEAAVKSLSVARETTSSLSSNLYREVKGLTSSELEQVMLKATRPDDTPVKGKHAERLVGVTYQISSRYDIYDAVLRKLWAKMAEKDWRTTIKALYILHRFSADGSPEHAAALKARVRELRRTRDPKRKEKFFSSKILLAGDNKPETEKFRSFMGRYAHYVLIRAQCFGGMFDEIAEPPTSKDKKKKSAPKPITSTSLRAENLEAAKLLLKAGTACYLKPGEECENTALAVERVASDLIGLSSAVAMALNRALKDDDIKGADPALIKKWCEFYSEELAPQTRAMVKKTTPKLDAFGLFLPSRMGATVSPDLIQKGLKLEEVDSTAAKADDAEVEEEEEGEEAPAKEDEAKEEEKSVEAIEDADEGGVATKQDEATPGDEDELDEEEEELDEYEYEEDEEYYDDEDEV